MNAVRISRLTTALVVVVGGLVIGHWVMPHRQALPGRAAFWTSMLALGAFRGWRESSVLCERGRRVVIRATVYGLGAMALAWIANAIVH